MPFDAAPVAPSKPRVRRIEMPWSGRNAAIIAAREAPPRLPRGWGASFSRSQDPRAARMAQQEAAKPRPAAVDAAVCTDWREAARTGKNLSQRARLYAALAALAAEGDEMPDWHDLAVGLFPAHTKPRQQLNYVIAQAVSYGLIVVHHINGGPHKGQRAIRLTDSGDVLYTAGCPRDIEW